MLVQKGGLAHMRTAPANSKTLPAIKVRQWLDEWDDVEWDPARHRARPLEWFYQFSIPATTLRSLSGIYRRTTDRKRAADDLGIQRRHEPSRSSDIGRFVRYGYPWSELSEAKRASDELRDLRQPGWLPTAIVVNILGPNDTRRGRTVAPQDLVSVEDGTGPYAAVTLPVGAISPGWRPSRLPPIEIIDGQHRLWAFSELDFTEDFELPVVAFRGLDLSWQAYLFYTINIKPKRINPSLAFDLYPMLRGESWLNRVDGHIIYREARAQELVDLLWAHPKSPWFHRINMLGEAGYKGQFVTQAAWVRSLLASFIKSWESRRSPVGGLFGSLVGSNHSMVLPWSRADQTAFLILAGSKLREAIAEVDLPWARALRSDNQPSLLEIDGRSEDPAFLGPNNLLSQDQGIRVFLHTINDLCYVRADELDLHGWGNTENPEETDEGRVNASITSLGRQRKIPGFLTKVARVLASFDWRASSGPELTRQEAALKAGYRGSGGYKALRTDVLRHLSHSGGEVGVAADVVMNGLKYAP